MSNRQSAISLTDTEHEVYEAEVVGLLLGLELLAREREVAHAVIFIDNQAVVRTLRAGATSNTGNIYEQLDGAIERVRRENAGIKLETRWIPGHEGVIGNEVVDVAAKRAANPMESTNAYLPDRLKSELPINQTAAKRTRRAGMKEEWSSWVKDEGKATRTERFKAEIDDDYPNLPFCQQAAGLTRHQFATLTQAKQEKARRADPRAKRRHTDDIRDVTPEFFPDPQSFARIRHQN